MDTAVRDGEPDRAEYRFTPSLQAISFSSVTAGSRQPRACFVSSSTTSDWSSDRASVPFDST